MADDDESAAEASTGSSGAGTTIGAVLGISLVLFVLLYGLLKIAKAYDAKLRARVADIELSRKKSRDAFRVQNGYSWDWVVVFKVLEEDEKTKPFQREHSVKWILSKFAQGGLQMRMFYSVQNDEVYCKLRATLERLEKEADRIDYKLPLDPQALQKTAERGREGKWGPLLIEDPHNQCPFGPYDYIYGKYEYNRPEVAHLYRRYENNTPFKGSDRIRLIWSIIKARPHEAGCFLDMPKLKKEKCVLTYFPLHDYKELFELEAKWLKFFMKPWDQPLDDVKDYFGEKVGLYFLWLGHYTTWLIAPSIVGFFVWIHVASKDNDPNAESVPAFAIFVALWVTFLLEYWKRKEITYSMRWGTNGFEATEQARPQFTGEVSKSPIDGSETLYFPTRERFKRGLTSQFIICGLILVVIGCVASIFVLKFILAREEVANGGVYASLVNAVVIQVLNAVYFNLALKFNDYENHRTDTEYEDALIAKVFVFQFVNSYAALFYIAFIKAGVDGCIVNCMVELSQGLGTIFLTRLAVGNLTEVGVPYVMGKIKEKKELQGVADDEYAKEPTEAEKQFLMAEYDVLLGSFKDYAELMIQHGYGTLFVAAYPLAMLVSFFATWVEVRVDAWKLCQQCRRVEPRTAEDIGTWYTILELLSTIAVITNSALVVFTGDNFESLGPATRVWLFVVLEHALLLIKYILALIVPDLPEEVDIQLKRQEFLVSKVIENAEDEQDDDLTTDVAESIDMTIRATDDDQL
mmetsp:Transcript_20422/g.69393  ORF Transcript_20422/g.69393 Transcript_20422/m.69393 type:complete len:748 (+) Transcript_20422:84-2327(+)